MHTCTHRCTYIFVSEVIWKLDWNQGISLWNDFTHTAGRWVWWGLGILILLGLCLKRAAGFSQSKGCKIERETGRCFQFNGQGWKTGAFWHFQSRLSKLSHLKRQERGLPLKGPISKHSWHLQKPPMLNPQHQNIHHGSWHLLTLSSPFVPHRKEVHLPCSMNSWGHVTNCKS